MADDLPRSEPGSDTPREPVEASISRDAPAFCTQCGSTVPEHSRFCPGCGTPFDLSSGVRPESTRATPTGTRWRARRIAFISGGALVIIIVAVLLALVLPSGKRAAAPPAPQTYTLTGTFTLTDSTSSLYNCQGTGGYSDIGPGTDVVVTNQNGTTIGTTQLGTGSEGTTTPYGLNTSCTYSFSVPDLPKESFYNVEVSHRGQLTYSFSQMVSNGWSVALTLGS